MSSIDLTTGLCLSCSFAFLFLLQFFFLYFLSTFIIPHCFLFCQLIDTGQLRACKHVTFHFFFFLSFHNMYVHGDGGKHVIVAMLSMSIHIVQNYSWFLDCINDASLCTFHAECDCSVINKISVVIFIVRRKPHSAEMYN